MTDKEDKMERCKTCKHYDREMSDKNWTVCPVIPLEVMMSSTSRNCKKYKKV